MNEYEKVFEIIMHGGAGWVHPGGRVENFDSYSPDDHSLDAYMKLTGKEGKMQTKKVEDALLRYLDQGHVRWMVDDIGGLCIEFNTQLDEGQLKSIRSMAQEYNYFYWDMFANTSESFSGNSWESFIEHMRSLCRYHDETNLDVIKGDAIKEDADRGKSRKI